MAVNFSREAAERLESIINDGIWGTMPFEQLNNELDLISQEHAGSRFEIVLDDRSEHFTFCAGSWAVSQLYGSRSIDTKITILGETTNGPVIARFSKYDNSSFSLS